jgi:hypothetical protein
MNKGKKWTPEEDALLLRELDTITKIEEIAISHGRTNGAVSSRSRRIASGFYCDGMSMDEIMKRCRLTKQGLIKTLQRRGLLKNEKASTYNEMATPVDRLAKVNEALKYAGGIPHNKWDYGKMRDMHENNIKEAMKRLEAHKNKVSELEGKYRLRAVEEAEIQKSIYQQFSYMHISLLEQVISAKKSLVMMDVGTVEELTRQKIAILEEIVSCEPQGLPTHV